MNATAVVTRPRLHWVDVMKVLGMFFIIYGHLFTYGYQYAYAFNVPVFFVLSGFLFKEDQPAEIISPCACWAEWPERRWTRK